MRRQEVLNARERASLAFARPHSSRRHALGAITQAARGGRTAKKEKRLGRRRIMIILSAHIKSACERAPAPRNYYYLARSVAHTHQRRGEIYL
jgi:hypothetical protein